MSPVPSRAGPLQRMLLAGMMLAIAFRLWTSLCFFPLTEWNNVRLAPTFMLFSGPAPYPGLGGGPLTTWIYGPVPLLLNLPARLAHDTIAALLIAGIINLLLCIVPAVAAVFARPTPWPETDRTARVWALLLCLAVWPNTSLQYIQADNTAVAFGLLSNLLLMRTRGGSGKSLLLAGLCAALAVWSKQSSLGLIPAQLLWLGLTAGRGATVRYAFLCAAFGLGLGAAFVGWFGFDGLWLNLVRIPGRLPFCEDWLARTRDFWMHLAGFVLLPAAGLIIARRAIWRRDSPWLLPGLTWLGLLPTALASAYKIGGATNSLNGFLYLLPTAALVAVGALRRIAPRTAQAWTAAGVIAIILQQLAFSPVLPLRPVTAHLIEAEQLARAFPGRIYFPWHPLVTYFGEHRFYHTEDGLQTRRAAQLGLDAPAMRHDLPPAWSITAIPGWREEGLFKQLQPPQAQLGLLGKWSVYTWPAAHGP